jgi:hypothetical protein
MSDTIAERSITYMRLTGGEEFSEIAKKRPLRYAFLEDTITPELVVPHVTENFESFFTDDNDTAYRMLTTGAIDAFFDEGIAEAAFDIYDDVRADDFFPPLFIRPFPWQPETPISNRSYRRSKRPCKAGKCAA